MGKEFSKKRAALALLAACCLQLAAPMPALASTAPPASVIEARRMLGSWQVPQAAELIKGLAADYPGDPAVLYVTARLAFFQGDYTKAKGELEHSKSIAELDPHAADLYELVKGTIEGLGEYTTIESDNFVLRVPKGKDEILGLYAFDVLEKSLAALTQDLNYRLEEKLLVEVYRNQEEFSKASPLTLKEIETSGTIALCKYNRLLITSPTALLRGYGWQDTLSHELVHLVVTHRSQNQVPIWMHEGIAKFEEDRWRSPVGGLLPPSQQNLLAEGLEKDYLITFDQMHPSFAKLKSSRDTGLAFAQVATIIEFIVREKGGYETLNKLIDESRKKGGAEKAVKTVLGLDFDGLHREWKQYLKTKRSLTRIPGLEMLSLEFRTGESEDPDEKIPEMDEGVEKYITLGNLLRNERRNLAAAKQYEKGLGVANGVSPYLTNKAANAYMLAERYDNAKKLLEKNLELYPSYGGSHVKLGMIALRKEDWTAAEKHLLTANGENPFDPSIHAALLQVYEKTGDTAGAAREIKALEILGYKKGE